MTKGNSVTNGTTYGNFIRGNNDKLMISYRREPSHDYTMLGACGVSFEGEIHFFGGGYFSYYNFTPQHFVIETQRNQQTVKMTEKENLEIKLIQPSCSSFEVTSEHFPWFQKSIVILCFDYYHEQSCYSFDGKINYIGDSNDSHRFGGLTKYRGNLLTAGGYFNQKTEILENSERKNFIWLNIESNLKFTEGDFVYGHSLVTVESSINDEEYVLLTGGINDKYVALENVFKFNGTWFLFGKLNKRRMNHSSIYWNGAVYVIGGQYYEGVGGGYEREENSYIYSDSYFSDSDDWSVQIGYENGILVTPIDDPYKTKMEIWNISNSKDQFNSIENWSELFGWEWPHLFIVHDSFFPDY